MKILVSGSRGFLGQNIIPVLESEGHTVIHYDLVDGHDIRDRHQLYYAVTICDAVIHLAAIVGISPCRDKMRQAIETNIGGTINIVEAVKLYEKPLIFASTFAARNPQSVYGQTKRIGERLVIDAGGTVLRMANIYGGKGFLGKESVVANFDRKRRKGDPVEIHGDGSQKRDFIHVEDIAQAFLLSLEAEPGLYEVYTGTDTSILQLAGLMEVDYEFKHSKEEKHPRILEKWKAIVSLGEGLRKLRGEGVG